MKDIERQDNYPSTSSLAKQGIGAVACTAGGIFLLVLQIISRFRILGLAVGGVACVVGISSLLSKDPDDKKAGAVITAAGTLVLLSKIGLFPWVKAAAGTLLGIGAVGLLAMGIWKGIKFFIGLKQRS
jgi:hypothetical protein